jgi:hypothetical protein
LAFFTQKNTRRFVERFGGLSISMIALDLAVAGRCRHVHRVMMMVAVMSAADHFELKFSVICARLSTENRKAISIR